MVQTQGRVGSVRLLALDRPVGLPTFIETQTIAFGQQMLEERRTLTDEQYRAIGLVQQLLNGSGFQQRVIAAQDQDAVV